MFTAGTKGADVTEFSVTTGAFIRAFVPELQVSIFTSMIKTLNP
jgi:hypothetical protein